MPLKTSVFTAAKLRSGDVEKEARGRSALARGAGVDVNAGYFIEQYRQRSFLDASLAKSSREKCDSRLKAITKVFAGS
ncbi:hypothetical protein [Nibricoccus aquaticus]|uniref:hypothetical protein n=1 Tax=Nibricoccus aquaticus TaxID=2576891 RepID=UPI0010FD3599|nr:hypothetical protein [Nibricoccus aquaticus]